MINISDEFREAFENELRLNMSADVIRHFIGQELHQRINTFIDRQLVEIYMPVFKEVMDEVLLDKEQMKAVLILQIRRQVDNAIDERMG